MALAIFESPHIHSLPPRVRHERQHQKQINEMVTFGFLARHSTISRTHLAAFVAYMSSEDAATPECVVSTLSKWIGDWPVPPATERLKALLTRGRRAAMSASSSRLTAAARAVMAPAATLSCIPSQFVSDSIHPTTLLTDHCK